MPDVTFRREGEREIIYAYRPMVGLAVALGLLGLMAVIYVQLSGWPRWLILFVNALFALLFIGYAFWRHELIFDLLQRRYTQRKGFWPRVRETTGSFDEIEHVALDSEVRTSSSDSSSRRTMDRVWIVRLKFRNEGKPISVAEEQDEGKGCARFESLAKRLRAPAVDRTGPQEKVTPWDRLDQSLAEKIEGQRSGWGTGMPVPPVPAGSRIEFADLAGGRTIVLPAFGFTFWLPLLLLLPAGFVLMGGLFVWTQLAPQSVHQQISLLAVVAGLVFFLIGLLLLFVFVGGLFGEDWIREEREELVFRKRIFGVTWGRRRMAKREIEEIEIKLPANPPADEGCVTVGSRSLPLGKPPVTKEVVVRSDRLLLRLGRSLSQEEREWLRAALTAMVR